MKPVLQILVKTHFEMLSTASLYPIKAEKAQKSSLKTCTVNYEIKNESAELSDLQILTHIQLNTAQILDISFLTVQLHLFLVLF